ncbi:hypothetical protein IU501_34675 [Nocardia otitidiscaviarum]|uniref:hypothetical protein n=1 Tax=Nocardia otitidiscaviarum TaxID=1823 RepID=UPI001893E718|nr:hypothetical protein [Nocardia otitidiscaviarum]MBF6138116.1 hypothetical protein [Nocardia otitidiscaviarum]
MRYRVRPRKVELEAIQLTRDNIAAVEEFTNGRVKEINIPGPGRGVHPGARITTLDGKLTAEWGDWIIRGTTGSLFTRDPAAFTETYEQVEDGG